MAWLRLARTPNVGPVTFAQLIARFGSASAALSEVPRLVRRGGGDAGKLPSEAEVRRELDALGELGGRLIASVEDDFRESRGARSASTFDRPLGHHVLLTREMIAMVGARNASALGRSWRANLRPTLAKRAWSSSRAWRAGSIPLRTKAR